MSREGGEGFFMDKIFGGNKDLLLIMPVSNQFKISPVFGSFVILFLLGLVVFCAKGVLNAYALQEHGITINGRVLSIHHETGKGKGFGNYFLNYSFDYNQATYYG